MLSVQYVTQAHTAARYVFRCPHLEDSKTCKVKVKFKKKNQSVLVYKSLGLRSLSPSSAGGEEAQGERSQNESSRENWRSLSFLSLLPKVGSPSSLHWPLVVMGMMP